MKQNRNKPNFLMVGAAKSGTTSIAAYLNEHPEIFIPETKEPKYFLYDIFKDINKKDPMYDMLMRTSVLEWEDYLKLYEVTAPEVKYFGDASVQYLYHYDTVIPKVKEKLGDIPIIIILRNPVERAYSNYKYQAAGQIISFEQALEEEEKIKREKYNSFWYYKGLGMYSKQVKAYKNNFSQVYIGLYDDFKSDPVNFMQELYTFLQVDRNFIPETTKKYNVRDVPINKLVHILYFFKRQKKLELNFLPEKVKRVLKKYLFVKNRTKINPSTEQMLAMYYKKDIVMLEKIIERDLSMWIKQPKTEKKVSKEEKNKPNTFLVGAAKSGTTSISEYFFDHDDIFVSPLKEPHYFSKDIRCNNFIESYRKRVCSFNIKKYLNQPILERKHIAYIDDYAEYIQLFREAKNEKIIMEMSTGYLYSSVAAKEIAEFNPDAKIIMILRCPVERAFSHWMMDKEISNDDDDNFVKDVLSDYKLDSKIWGGVSRNYIELGLYYEQVKRYYDAFPVQNIKIYLFDDLKKNTSLIIDDLYDFLDTEKIHQEYVEFNSSKVYKNFLIKKIASNIFIRKLSSFLGESFKRKTKRFIYVKSKIKLTAKDREVLLPYFYNDIIKLEKLIGQDLSTWYDIEGFIDETEKWKKVNENECSTRN